MNAEADNLVHLAVSEDVCDCKDQECAAQLGISGLQRRHDPDANKEPYRLNRPSS